MILLKRKSIVYIRLFHDQLLEINSSMEKFFMFTVINHLCCLKDIKYYSIKDVF